MPWNQEGNIQGPEGPQGDPGPGMPVGAVVPWIGVAGTHTTPTGWLLADGSYHLISQYPDLAALLPEVVPGYFATPYLINRVPVGAGLDYDVNEFVGEKEHTLITSEMPGHSHKRGIIYRNATASNPGNRLATGGSNFFYANNGTGYTADHDGTDAAGGNGAHNNMQPSIGMTYIIRAL